MADYPIMNDFHRYLLSQQTPPSYVAQAQDQAPLLPQVVDHPSGESLPAMAEGKPDPRKWSLTDKLLQGGFAGMSLFDALNTNSTLSHNRNAYEENPLLGRRPSLEKLLGATILGQGAHALITDQLPQPWRRIWQLGTIGAEGSVIGANYGVKPFTKINPYAIISGKF